MTPRQLFLINSALLCGGGACFLLAHISGRAPSSAPPAASTPLPTPSLTESRWAFPIAAQAAAHRNNELGEVAAGHLSLLQHFPSVRARDRTLDELSTRQQKAHLEVAYSSLFRELSLSPAKLEKLKDLLAEKDTIATDALEIANTEGLHPLENAKAFRELLRSVSADTLLQIEELLGPSGYQIYREYQDSLPLRNSLEQLRQRLSNSSAPISAGEISRVVDRLRSSRSDSDDAERSVLTEALGAYAHEPLTLDDLGKLGDILNPSQLAALETIVSAQEAQLKLAREMGTNTPSSSR